MFPRLDRRQRGRHVEEDRRPRHRRPARGHAPEEDQARRVGDQLRLTRKIDKHF